MGAAFVIQTILTLLFMPETAFHRRGALDIDTGEHAVVIYKDSTDKGSVEQVELETTGAEGTTGSPPRSQSVVEEKKTWAREMLPWDGYYDEASFLRTLARPFLMLLSPVVVWATLLFGSCISWLVLISITLSQIFSAPPYNFSVGAVGATNMSSFVASFLGTLAAGPLVDGLVRYMARMNKGTFGKFLLHDTRWSKGEAIHDN
jgi:hypothetical protein